MKWKIKHVERAGERPHEKGYLIENRSIKIEKNSGLSALEEQEKDWGITRPKPANSKTKEKETEEKGQLFNCALGVVNQNMQGHARLNAKIHRDYSGNYGDFSLFWGGFNLLMQPYFLLYFIS